MSKWIISADWHIGDYSNYNYSPNSRLYQFPRLAERVVELAKSHESDVLLILGDFIDIPINTPKVELTIKQTLDILKRYFNKIYYITGQHDKYTKSNTNNHEDTMLSLFDDDKFIYMDRQILSDGGHEFGFQDWTPAQDTSWIENKVDILFGHFTKSTLFGQDIDESKFDLMIHGDIHNRQEIGKFISVCNPIQHDMKSDPTGDVLLFDTEKLTWSRLDIDPDHTRFLRLSYTEDIGEEGFKGPLQYNIYRPKLEVTGIEENSKTITWDTIDELIDECCRELEVSDLHSEILSKAKSYDEIDFNFQVDKVYIDGYRSIIDLELDFTRGDRVALLGENGCGKSSIIRAIRDSFGKNSVVKNNISYYSDTVTIRVELTYQNKKYIITKGTNWGLEIDGQEQSYNGVRDFESDLIEKLPFIEYLDLMFIDSRTSNLSGQFSQNRRIELISKFYRLDRIIAYSDTAKSICNNIREDLIELEKDLRVSFEVKYRLESRLLDIKERLEGFTKESVESELDKIRKDQDLKSRMEIWEKDMRNLAKELDSKEYNLKILESNLTLNISDAEEEVEIKTKTLSEYDSKLETLGEKIKEFSDLINQLEVVETQGKELRSKYDLISTGVCPECNTELSTVKGNELLDSYKSQLDEVRSKWSDLMEKLDSHPEGRESKEFYAKAILTLKKNKDEDFKALEFLKNKITQYQLAKVKIDSVRESIQELKVKKDSLEKDKPEEVILDIDHKEKESSLISKLAMFSEKENLDLELEGELAKIAELEDQVKLKKVAIDRYTSYAELMSTTGLVFEKILIQLANKFTTSEVKYEVTSGVYRGNRYITFESYYKNKKRFIIYDDCSDGQMIVCDIDFLSKLFSVNVGLLVLDEYLKHLDRANFTRACEILEALNVNTLILSTHDDSLSVYTKRLLLNLNLQGITEVNNV